MSFEILLFAVLLYEKRYAVCD